MSRRTGTAIKFPPGINKVFGYYRREGYGNWCYLGVDVSKFIQDFLDGKRVRLGMKHEDGSFNVATFKKSQIDRQADWDDDREPTQEERQYFRSPRSRSRSTRDVHERHRSRTPGRSVQEAPDFETVRASFEAAMREHHRGQGMRPQIVWFDSDREASSQLRAGKGLKVAVKIHHGSLTIYKIGPNGRIEKSRKASESEEDNVLRALGYRE